ncbi:hypothetical protein [Mycoavidus sp. SF9855]|uniref:hypothetical protein n=1 Tax=Mycoavidus sp. SF9855 TaxID=2968475 RepID=UPI00211BA4CA|nr:hypothetical protein [Mycoavidus sp. SF9855]UUM22141.1 hypothetical protein NQD60_03380 [Mycoavidus sp. SF9855]
MPLFLRCLAHRLCHNRHEIFQLQRAYHRYASAPQQATLDHLRTPQEFGKPRLSLAWACCRLTLEQPTVLPAGMLALAGLFFFIVLHLIASIG